MSPSLDLVLPSRYCGAWGYCYVRNSGTVRMELQRVNPKSLHLVTCRLQERTPHALASLGLKHNPDQRRASSLFTNRKLLWGIGMGKAEQTVGMIWMVRFARPQT